MSGQKNKFRFLISLLSARPDSLAEYNAYYVELHEKFIGNIIFAPTDLVFLLFFTFPWKM